MQIVYLHTSPFFDACKPVFPLAPTASITLQGIWMTVFDKVSCQVTWPEQFMSLGSCKFLVSYSVWQLCFIQSHCFYVLYTRFRAASLGTCSWILHVSVDCKVNLISTQSAGLDGGFLPWHVKVCCGELTPLQMFFRFTRWQHKALLWLPFTSAMPTVHK